MDFSRAYAILCGAASDAIDLIDQEAFPEARDCLLAALERTEELYISETGNEDAV